MTPAKRSSITLTTIGRLSGTVRSATLYAFEDGDQLVIVGSRGGAARDPAWAINLRNHPRARVRVGKAEAEVEAREVRPVRERERLWDLVTQAFPMYATFQKRTKRLIPIFVLELLTEG